MKLSKLSYLLSRHPRQFWIMLAGEFVSIIGRSMVFPFLTLYLHGRLGMPLTTVGLLMALYSIAGAVGQGLGGTLADRLGRKPVMALSLLASVGATLSLAFARSPLPVGVLLSLYGLMGSLYDPASSAMISDLIPEGERAEAYSLWRVAGNAGIAIGPAIGGLLASLSYLYIFGGGALGCLVMFLVILTMRETRPAEPAGAGTALPGGYRDILRDVPFVVFIILFPLSYLVYSLVLQVMPVYMSDQYGLGERYFGLLMSVNAAMVVLFQFPMTRLVRRIKHLHIVAAGVAISSLATAGVAGASRFGHFMLVIVVLTLGENLFVPTANTVAADMAPPELRGRYMGAMGLTWIMGWGGAPLVAGLLSDWFGPRSPWLIGGAAGMLFAGGLLLLSRYVPARRAQTAEA